MINRTEDVPSVDMKARTSLAHTSFSIQITYEHPNI